MLRVSARGRAARNTLLLGAFLASLCAGQRAQATVMIELTLEELIAQSDAIVHAKVERTGTQMAHLKAWMPHSVARLRVLRWLAGHGGSHVVVRDPGASWATGAVRVDGSPSYREGEEVIAFLKEDEAGYHRTFAMAQGKFVVERRDDGGPASVARDPARVSFVRFEPDGMLMQSDTGTAGAAFEIFVDFVRRQVEEGSPRDRREAVRVQP